MKHIINKILKSLLKEDADQTMKAHEYKLTYIPTSSAGNNVEMLAQRAISKASNTPFVNTLNEIEQQQFTPVPLGNVGNTPVPSKPDGTAWGPQDCQIWGFGIYYTQERYSASAYSVSTYHKKYTGHLFRNLGWDTVPSIVSLQKSADAEKRIPYYPNLYFRGFTAENVNGWVVAANEADAKKIIDDKIVELQHWDTDNKYRIPGFGFGIH